MHSTDTSVWTGMGKLRQRKASFCTLLLRHVEHIVCCSTIPVQIAGSGCPNRSDVKPENLLKKHNPAVLPSQSSFSMSRRRTSCASCCLCRPDPNGAIKSGKTKRKASVVLYARIDLLPSRFTLRQKWPNVDASGATSAAERESWSESCNETNKGGNLARFCKRLFKKQRFPGLHKVQNGVRGL